MPSGDSTPRASGFDSRCSARSWLTSGGPRTRRFAEYQKLSGRRLLSSSSAADFRVATSACLPSRGHPPAFISPCVHLGVPQFVVVLVGWQDSEGRCSDG